MRWSSIIALVSLAGCNQVLGLDAPAGDAGGAHTWRETIPQGQVHDANAHALGGVAGHAGLFGTAASVGALGKSSA